MLSRTGGNTQSKGAPPMFTMLKKIPGPALVAVTVLALLLSSPPALLHAQQVISADGGTIKGGVKGLDDPEYVGKWDFTRDGRYDGWRPLQAAGGFTSSNGLVATEAKSQRPCLDLFGPYSAEQISVIEIRMRGVAVERETPAGDESSMIRGANDRVRVLPSLYKGTRLYFTTQKKESFNAEKSIDIPLVPDGKFHIFTIKPGEHENWEGLIQKIRLDLGDFPNYYELDYIHFHRVETRAKGAVKGGKSLAKAGATSTETKK